MASSGGDAHAALALAASHQGRQLKQAAEQGPVTCQAKCETDAGRCASCPEYAPQQGNQQMEALGRKLQGEARAERLALLQKAVETLGEELCAAACGVE